MGPGAPAIRDIRMDDWKTAQRLRLLLRFHLRTSEVCTKVREKATRIATRNVLEQIGRDHERHLQELRDASALGGLAMNADEPSELTVLHNALSTLDSNISEQTKVRACLQWEEHLVEGYDEALVEKHPPHITALLQRHRAVESDHLASLKSLLEKEAV